MSEYWEIILAMTIFFLLISLQINRFWKEVEDRLKKMQGDLWRIEDKADSMERHRETN